MFVLMFLDAPSNRISATAKRLVTMDIALYESGGNRSARVRWTALECGIAYENAGGTELIGSDDLKTVHPLAKLPAAMIDGKPHSNVGLTSTVSKDKKPIGHNCPASKQGNECKSCRACWNINIPNVNYAIH